VWVAAVTAADPDVLRTFPTPVSLEVLGQDAGLVITGALSQDVRVTMRAPQSVWSQLTARPDSVRAVLDLTGVEAGEHAVQVKILVDARPVRVVAVNPSTIAVKMEPLVSRAMPLESALTGQPAVGYEAGALTLDPQRVVVRGPQSVVSRVAHARVLVNASDKRESIEQDNPIVPLDENNAPLAGLTISPETAHVSLPVIRLGGFRDMAVKVVLHGEVAAGYRLDSISVFPPVVTVYSANPELVNSLPGVVETQPLDLKAASSSLSLRASLDVPTGVSVVGQQDVLIQAGISPIQSSYTLSAQKVEVNGLPDNLEAQVSPAAVDVIVSGPIPVLNTLTRQDVHVVLDVTNLAPGSYQLAPSVQILASNLAVESLLPGTVEVVLVSKASPTTQP
jgi:YbbR domain-containing protein